MTSLKKILATGALLFAPLAMMQSAMAEFPDKPLKIVVPYSTGGSSDSIGRLVADNLSKELGQPVIIENKPGAGSMIGTAYAADQAPDGYTLLLVDVPFTIVPSLYKNNIKYNAREAFSPIALVGESPMYLFVNTNIKAKNPQQLADLAKAEPDTLTIGSGGNGSFSHLLAELYMRESGIKLIHVPYKSSGASITDLAGGQIDAGFGSLASASALYHAGKVVPIGVSSAERHPDTPDVPTFKESGYESMSIPSWWGLVVPANTPEDVKTKLTNAMLKGLQDPVLAQRLRPLGVDIPEKADPATMAKMIDEDLSRWEDVITSANIVLN